MKTKKIALSAAVAFLVMAFFVGGMVPVKAAATTNMTASVVIGQQNTTSGTANQGGSADLNKLYDPRGMWSNGTKLIVADGANNRVLIFNSIPTSNNANADVVIGQQDMTSNSANQGGSVTANTLYYPFSVWSDGEKLFVADMANNRVLIYDHIPTSNNAAANVVVGQQDMVSNGENQGGSVGANTLFGPLSVYSDGIRLLVTDGSNNRITIYNTIPTANNAAANVVVGQPDKTSSSDNQGGGFTPAANTLYAPYGLTSDGQKLFIADWGNNRVLVYNSIPTADNANANVVIGQANMTTPAAAVSTAANTLFLPSEIFRFGNKLAITDRGSNRVLIYNSIPASNGASADVVVGQANMTSDTINQGGGATVAANTLNNVRGITFGGTKMFVSDTENNRVLVYEVGADYAIGKNKSSALVLGEKMKVKKKNFEFSGKRTDLKKGRVRLMVAGSSKKVVKIAKNGKWSIKFNHKTAGVVRIKFKFYNSSGTDIQNSNDYFVQVSHNGSLAPVMLEKSDYKPMEFSRSTAGTKSSGKIDRKSLSW
jgi:hypothetical protein